VLTISPACCATSCAIAAERRPARSPAEHDAREKGVCPDDRRPNVLVMTNYQVLAA
jgi:hypothetical protein